MTEPVKPAIIEKHECPECLELYEDQDEAIDCCPPTIHSKLVCTVCNEAMYAHLSKAEEKMQDHLSTHQPHGPTPLDHYLDKLRFSNTPLIELVTELDYAERDAAEQTA